MENTQVLTILKNHKDELFSKFNIKKLGVFGSYARGEEVLDSDVDVLVEYSKTPGFFGFLELEEELQRLVNKKIDLTTESALKALIKERILKETVYI